LLGLLCLGDRQNGEVMHRGLQIRGEGRRVAGRLRILSLQVVARHDYPS
jgi:hypothetical protein